MAYRVAEGRSNKISGVIISNDVKDSEVIIQGPGQILLYS